MATPTPAVPTRPATVPAPPAKPAPPPPRSGDLTDQGAVVREATRARSWTLKGWGKVAGALDLDRLSVDGDLAVSGAALVDRCDSHGHLTIDGPTTGTGPWTLDGEHRFGGAVRVQALRSRGRLDVKGALTVEQALDAEGTLDVTGELSAASVRWHGAARVGGDVVAPEIQITVGGLSKVAALRGDRVRVDRPRGRPGKEPPTLEVLEIEAQEATLVGVVAQHVRADRILLGPGCRISGYEGTLVSRDRHAVVGPQRRSAPPPGLWR